MVFKAIYSDRHFQNWPSWQLVFEWEDEISKRMNIPILNSPIPKTKVEKLISAFFLKYFKNDFTSYNFKFLLDSKKYLYFEMILRKNKSFSNSKKVIPIIIDFWKSESVKEFEDNYKRSTFVLISSLEVLYYLKSAGCNLKLYHFPLSLPDSYYLSPSTVFKKKIDVIVTGIRNPILWKFLKKYEKQNPQIEYYFQEKIDSILYYRSNKNKELINIQSREAYVNLIRQARVALYATPGIDGGEKRTGGFNQITPRFLEFLAAGCHVVARYPNNEESEYYQMNTICTNVETYTDFKQQLDEIFSSDIQPIVRNSEYLKNHYTTVKIDHFLKTILNE